MNMDLFNIKKHLLTFERNKFKEINARNFIYIEVRNFMAFNLRR